MTFKWSIFFQYAWPPTAFRNPLVLYGFFATLIMSVTAQLLGIILGLIAALARMSRFRLVRWPAVAYIQYYRGTPVLVQLVLLYFGLPSVGLYGFPDLLVFGLRIPGIMQAGILGLGIAEGAFMAEIIRAGILAVDVAQHEAAKSLGMTYAPMMRRIVLPQATPIIIPPLGNEFNTMMKATALTVVIGSLELFNAFQQINAVLFRPFELFLAVSLYYLALSLIWNLIQARLERRYGPKSSLVRPRGVKGTIARV